MSSLRTLRPLARAFQRPIARPSCAAFTTKSSKMIAPATPAIATQVKLRTKQQSAKPTPAPTPMPTIQVLQASMPQLVPFYFVNETTFTWILLPTVIYILSKYVLPQQVRKMAARLFISKL